MKLNLIAYETLLAAFLLAACGSDSGTSSGKESSESKAQYKSFDELPNCTSTREGEIVEILDDGVTYICKSKKWEEYAKTELNSYKTEDDMPNCSSKNENSLALVEADSVVQVCKDSRWETLGHPYANEDALPNCSKKRDGEKAYLIEEDEVQVCKDGVWGATKDNNDKKNEPKSSGKEESSDSKVTEPSSDSKNESGDGQNSQSNNSGEGEDSSDSESEHSSTSIASGVTEGTFTDSRDGQKYRTVKIGDQVWFAQNLNYDTGDYKSLCPLEDPSYCEKYGRLYIDPYPEECPKGWHVPFETEWNELFTYVANNNGGEGVGKSLKATSGWYKVDNIGLDPGRKAVATGDDLFRFSALPAGSCWMWNGEEYTGGCYSDDDALFWSIDGAGYKICFDKDLLSRDGNHSYTAASIRCIKDGGLSSNSKENNTDLSSSSVFLSSGNVNNDHCDGVVYDEATQICDNRDGNVYRIVTIGTGNNAQTWMAENLNFNASGSSCYKSSLSNCETYGRMYSQSVAMDVCPDGWHLPSSTEWTTLLGNVSPAKMLLKENDSEGFAALLAGSSINAPGSYAIFWTSDPGKDANIGGTTLNGVYGTTNSEELVYVRCIKGT